MTMDTTFEDPEARNEKLSHVAEFLHRWAATRRRPLHTGRGVFIRNRLDAMWKRSGYFLVGLFLLVKALYLVVSLLQFQVTSMFLGINYWTFAPRALSTSLLHRSAERHSGAARWLSEDVFPRVAVCDFRLRQMMNVQVYSVQCVLSINIFLEKMYLFLWFFLVIMVVANLYSLISWSIDLLSARKTRHFLDKFAHVITPGKTPRNSEIRQFNSLVRGYLKSDGIFLVKMIAANTTDILAADLLRQIWVRYKEYMHPKNPQHTPATIFPTAGGASNGDEKEDNHPNTVIPH